ncbi:MAG: Tad domain-containing protein [Rhodobacteraceae bacterium]|nr:Tad domain-containing protein [Paracoccaceae bacterium]
MQKRAKERLTAYRQDEEGSVIAFVVILFLLMVVASGMAVDFMRHETARADLQNALDRGVLAAAALKQTYIEEKIASDPNLTDDADTLNAQYAELVKAYMMSRSFPAEPNVTVDVQPSFNGKTIVADADYELNTFFLRIAGMNRMKVPARAAATQVIHNLEISLVLDISGSMYNENNRTTYVDDQGDDDPENDVTYQELRSNILKKEAKKFVGLILDSDTSPNRDKRAISVIPYSHQVALPAAMAEEYATFDAEQNPDAHTRNYCIDFAETPVNQFTRTLIDPDVVYKQTRHFWYSGNSSNKVYGCSKPENTILPYSNNKTAIGTMIDGMTEEYWTAIYQGMKWGVSLLDPGSRPVIGALADKGVVDSRFRDLPRDWNPTQTMKVVVLISDGANTRQPRVAEDRYFSLPPQGEDPVEWWDTHKKGTINGSRCDDSSVSNNKPIWWANNSDYSGGSPSCPNYVGDYTTYDETITKDDSGDAISLGDARLYDICAQAKQAGILVYTIGFNAGTRAERALAECADAGRAHTADGRDLGTVFDAIANDLETLKLIN